MKNITTRANELKNEAVELGVFSSGLEHQVKTLKILCEKHGFLGAVVTNKARQHLAVVSAKKYVIV